MIIGIDHGNHAIKTAGCSFTAGLAEHAATPPAAEDILEYGGSYWTLSGRRIPYMKDKAGDDRYFILTLFAIAKELERRDAHSPTEKIRLAIGLPPGHYGALRKKFEGYFTGRGLVEFSYNGMQRRIIIQQATAYPQAYAAAVTVSSRIMEAPRLFLIDIGGFTTDVLLLRNGKPDLQYCHSLETGTITMGHEIARKAGAMHDMRIENGHIRDVLCGDGAALPEGVLATIRTEAGRHAKGILDQLRELQVDLRANPALFMGGGSILLRPYIEQSPLVLNAEFLADTRANAKGYELLARAQMEKDGEGQEAGA